MNEKIKLEPKFLNKHFREELQKRLVKKLEGICSKHGYIRHNTIKIHKIKPGLVELISLNGHIQYDVYFHAEVCNPHITSVIKCKITNTNKFGILAEAGYRYEGHFYSILEVIIAKNSVSIKSDINLDDKKEGDIIKVEIVGKKFELNDKKISLVGRIANSSKPSKKEMNPIKLAAEPHDDVADVEDVDETHDVEEDDDSDADESDEEPVDDDSSIKEGGADDDVFSNEEEEVDDDEDVVEDDIDSFDGGEDAGGDDVGEDDNGLNFDD